MGKCHALMEMNRGKTMSLSTEILKGEKSVGILVFSEFD
jgi:hypothetical protein